jgi:hypothetical protein
MLGQRDRAGEYGGFDLVDVVLDRRRPERTRPPPGQDRPERG